MGRSGFNVAGPTYDVGPDITGNSLVSRLGRRRVHRDCRPGRHG